MIVWWRGLFLLGSTKCLGYPWGHSILFYMWVTNGSPGVCVCVLFISIVHWLCRTAHDEFSLEIGVVLLLSPRSDQGVFCQRVKTVPPFVASTKMTLDLIAF